MSSNLIATCAKYLTPELQSRLASVLGIDQSTIEKAVSAGIPAVLASFLSLINKPSGATRLADAVAQQQPGIPAGLASGGLSEQKDMLSNGFSALSSLLGGGTVSTLTHAINRYAGTGEAASKGLLGLLGPLALGALGQQQRAGGLDASGIAQLLQSQAGSITRALPSGMARQLSEAGIVEQPPASSGRMRGEARSDWGWLAPALAVVALGALGWYLFGRSHQENVATAPTEISQPAAQPMIVAENEVAKWIGRPVYSSDNVKIGEIVEINRGPDNRIVDIIFDSGAAMGMGAVRHRALASQFQEVKPESVTLTVKEAEVATVPSPQP